MHSVEAGGGGGGGSDYYLGFKILNFAVLLGVEVLLTIFMGMPV